MVKTARILRFVLGLANMLAIASLFAVKPDTIEPASTPWEWWGWIAKPQFVPAVLAANFAVLGAIAAATFLFGRVYCDVICPLGVAQDVLRKATFAKRLGVRRVCVNLPVSAANWAVRCAVLAAFAVCGALGLGYWLDPYAIFCRAAAGTEFVLFAAVAALAFVGKGRIWCNWICPAGTVFAAAAKFTIVSKLPGMKKNRYDRHCGNCRACFPKKGDVK